MVAPWRGRRASSCLYECFGANEQRLDPQKYYLYRRAQREELDKNDWLKIIAACDSIAQSEHVAAQNVNRRKPSTVGTKRKFQREHPEPRIFRDPVDGEIKAYGPEHTEWYRIYVEDPNLENLKFRSKFRRRFRCSYNSYTKHLADVKESPLFQTWVDNEVSASGKVSSPIELLVLGALRYLGRGWCFDDLEEQTCIGEDTHRRFIHVYLLWGLTTLYEKYVSLPEDGEEAKGGSAEYWAADFPGCISSGDATHIAMNRCYFQLKQHNYSHKLKSPSRTYNMHVTHRRRILHTTPGHPGRWNDQSLQLFDSYAKALRDGKRFDDLVFELKERRGDGTVKTVKYCGAWEIVDNGYLPWPTMIPPSKYPRTYAEMQFLKWIESLRKDVECTFGILKGRFRILKIGCNLHGIEVCDRMWLTCCALHNFLLVEDGLDKAWDTSVYLNEEGGHDFYDARRYVGTSVDGRRFDRSGMGAGSDLADCRPAQPDVLAAEEETDIASELAKLTVDGAIPVHHLPHHWFKQKLIEHFDIEWHANRVMWPSRNGIGKPKGIVF